MACALVFANSQGVGCKGAEGSGDGAAGTETGGDGDGDGDPDQRLPDDELEWPALDCDPIAPAYCAFPFPSNVYTVADDQSATGRRVNLGEATLPAPNTGITIDPAPWNLADGFSPGGAILVHLPGASEEGLARQDRIDDSVSDGTTTALVDADTLELVPHFAELDLNKTSADTRTLIVRPAQRLKTGHRYLVAVRGVVNAQGDPIEASEAFAALRDGTDSTEPSVEDRRALYGDIFARLAEAGVDKQDLIVAWDFTTASQDNLTRWALQMRDESFAALGDAAPTWSLTEEVSDWENDTIMHRLKGTFEAPLYMTGPGSGQRLNLDADGVLTQNGTVDVPFEIIIPNVAANGPVALMQHGHGLLGSYTQIESSHFREVADQYGYAVFGVDLVGMATNDVATIAGALVTGDIGGLAKMTDRLHQGTLNHLLAMRVMHEGLASDPTYGALLNGDERYYYGISQGGIFGGVYMGLSTEVTRGVLDVPGQPYNLLLRRSVDFDGYLDILAGAFDDDRDIAYGLTLIQMLWDRSEPTGYSAHIRDPLPGTPAHEVLMTAAVGDHQVTTLGAHHMARTVGATHLDTGVRSVYDLEAQTDPVTGSAYVEYDFGLPEDPLCNLPQRECDDPHGKLRRLPAAREQIDTFLRTGMVENYCDGGVCSFPEQSGCVGGETNEGVCG